MEPRRAGVALSALEHRVIGNKRVLPGNGLPLTLRGRKRGGGENEGGWGERMGQQPPAPIPALRDHLGSGFGSRPGEQIRSS